MLTGVQEVPLKVNEFPLRSTAAQNDADGHDTEVREFVPSILAGALQELPLKVIARPSEATAAQNDAGEGAQDTDVAENAGPST